MSRTSPRVFFSLMALAALAFLASMGAADAAPLNVDHVGLVPEIPRIDFPDILDGDVYAVIETGHWIVAGGDFTTIELPDGTLVNQPFLAAFDRDSGRFVDTFRPVLNGEVNSLSAGLEADDLFVGGAFTSVSGRQRFKLAKLALPGGEVDTGWIANASASVTALHLSDDGRLFAGGSFKKVKGIDQDNVVEIDPTTDAVNPAFNFVFAGEGSNRSGGQNIKHLSSTPDGRLFIVHSAATIDGNERLAVAFIDINNPAAPFLTDYSINSFFDGAPRGALPTDGDLAPDGSYYALSTNIGDTPPWHDMVLAFPAAGGSDTAPLWTHPMRDSVFAIGISNNAVYAGGHFCRIAPGPGAYVEAGRTDKVCSGSNNSPGAWRWQLAALNPADGTPLDWDPGSNAFRGAQTLTVTDRGLLIGADGSSIGGRTVGRVGFMDFGPGVVDNAAPTVAITSPAAGLVGESPLLIEGLAADDYRVTRVKVRVKVIGQDQWVQPDGTLAATLYDFEVEPGFANPGASVNWDFAINAPDGEYRIEARANDPAGNVSGSAQVVVTIGPIVLDCQAQDVNGSVVLDWDAVPGENTYSVRRNGTFLATVGGGALTYTDGVPVAGDNTYVVRANVGGVETNLSCGTVNIDVPVPECSAVVIGDDVVLDWDAVSGVVNYIVRRDGAFVTRVTGAFTYTDLSPVAGGHSYIVRVRAGGVTTDIDCGSIVIDPPPKQVCIATPAGADVVLSWDAIAGEDTYFVRRNGGFLANAGAALAYTDVNAPAGATYIVRSTQGGIVTDTVCA